MVQLRRVSRAAQLLQTVGPLHLDHRRLLVDLLIIGAVIPERLAAHLRGAYQLRLGRLVPTGRQLTTRRVIDQLVRVVTEVAGVGDRLEWWKR